MKLFTRLLLVWVLLSINPRCLSLVVSVSHTTVPSDPSFLKVLSYSSTHYYLSSDSSSLDLLLVIYTTSNKPSLESFSSKSSYQHCLLPIQNSLLTLSIFFYSVIPFLGISYSNFFSFSTSSPASVRTPFYQSTLTLLINFVTPLSVAFVRRVESDYVLGTVLLCGSNEALVLLPFAYLRACRCTKRVDSKVKIQTEEFSVHPIKLFTMFQNFLEEGNNGNLQTLLPYLPVGVRIWDVSVPQSVRERPSRVEEGVTEGR